MEFEGVVIKKYLDRLDHSTPIAELKNLRDSIEKIYLFGDHSGLFDRITDGDSLRKYKGTSEVLKKVNNEYVRFGYAQPAIKFFEFGLPTIHAEVIKPSSLYFFELGQNDWILYGYRHEKLQEVKSPIKKPKIVI